MCDIIRIRYIARQVLRLKNRYDRIIVSVEDKKMKKYIAVGYPDEENIYSGNHTRREEWEFYARDEKDATRKAFDHFYYFHEVGVWEA